MITRAKRVAALGTLALAGGSSGVALAGSQIEHPGLGQYIVRISVTPKVVRGHGQVHITVEGRAAKPVDLAVYAASDRTCYATAEGEATHGHFLYRIPVNGRITPVHSTYSAHKKGTWHACAYLYTRADHSLAGAQASWREE